MAYVLVHFRKTDKLSIENVPTNERGELRFPHEWKALQAKPLITGTWTQCKNYKDDPTRILSFLRDNGSM